MKNFKISKIFSQFPYKSGKNIFLVKSTCKLGKKDMSFLSEKIEIKIERVSNRRTSPFCRGVKFNPKIRFFFEISKKIKNQNFLQNFEN
jgi:hypothetical protein